MRGILEGTVQPSALVLLNTASEPAVAPLWTKHIGSEKRSHIAVIDDGEYPSGAVPRHPQVGSITGKVVHLQSPNVGDTYLQIGEPSSSKQAPLGAQLDWLGVQIKPLGRRPLAIEVGLVDADSVEGRIRLESWRKEPHLDGGRALICLPLEMPPEENRVTEWAELVVSLPPLLALFQKLKSSTGSVNGEGDSRKRPKHDLPSQRLQSVSYVRLYASCRVRRIWLSNEGRVKDEWALWAATA